ncbi:MAG: hypothetical protein GTO14_10510 [Anaerolineales bacterium]|nr:hypothetical protein [Anaerolineales bacterium]
MRIMLLGVGMQGQAALDDLVRSEDVSEVIAADREVERLKAYKKKRGYGEKVRCEHVDASDLESLDRLLAFQPDVLIDLLPVAFIPNVVSACLKHRTHLVNTNYVPESVKALSSQAEAKGITILPEFGLDPGIDLVLLGEAVRSLDTVEEITLYGAGIPDADSATNPIRYKVSWTLEGVLRSYNREARVIRDGEVIEIEGRDLFSPENIHEIEIQGLGMFEAFPNDDALPYLDMLNIDKSQLRKLGRYTMRWPGHSAFWKAVVDLHLLDDEPVTLDGFDIDRKRFLAAALNPHLQYGPNEVDLAIVRVEVSGQKRGKPAHIVYQLVDRRDLDTGFTAMSRTVGYSTSIGAQLIGSNAISKRGLLSPTRDIPFDVFISELAKRDIHVTSEIDA